MKKTKNVYFNDKSREILEKTENQNGYINNAIALYSCLEEVINPIILQAFISDSSQFDVEFILKDIKKQTKISNGRQVESSNINKQKKTIEKPKNSEIVDNLSSLKIY